MKMEQIECSETSAYIIQTPGNYPKENIIYSEHGESLKSRKAQYEFTTLRSTCNTLFWSCSASPLHTTLFYPLCTYESYWYTTVFTSPILLSFTLKSTLIRMWTHIPCHSQHTQWSHSNNGTLKNGVIGLPFAYRILQGPYYLLRRNTYQYYLCLSYHF